MKKLLVLLLVSILGLTSCSKEDMYEESKITNRFYVTLERKEDVKFTQMLISIKDEDKTISGGMLSASKYGVIFNMDFWFETNVKNISIEATPLLGVQDFEGFNDCYVTIYQDKYDKSSIVFQKLLTKYDNKAILKIK